MGKGTSKEMLLTASISSSSDLWQFLDVVCNVKWLVACDYGTICKVYSGRRMVDVLGEFVRRGHVNLYSICTSCYGYAFQMF